jgi:hypothetical protein
VRLGVIYLQAKTAWWWGHHGLTPRVETMENDRPDFFSEIRTDSISQ